jgi:hypothetical protein
MPTVSERLVWRPRESSHSARSRPQPSRAALPRLFSRSFLDSTIRVTFEVDNQDIGQPKKTSAATTPASKAVPRSSPDRSSVLMECRIAGGQPTLGATSALGAIRCCSGPHRDHTSNGYLDESRAAGNVSFIVARTHGSPRCRRRRRFRRYFNVTLASRCFSAKSDAKRSMSLSCVSNSTRCSRAIRRRITRASA